MCIRSLPSTSRLLPALDLSSTTNDLRSLLLRHRLPNGKFQQLFPSFISDPSVLLSASQSLNPTTTTTTTNTILSLSHSLRHCLFDPNLHLLLMQPSRLKGLPRAFPSPTLRLLIEAVRLTLEAIYCPRFLPFSYSAPGLGRHTALRYLKSSVPNPSWWFAVHFRHRGRFHRPHINKLLTLMEQRISDEQFIKFIEWLFEKELIVIELGGLEIGRGLPQDCGIAAILLNIYLNGLDHAIQDLRFKVKRENQVVVWEGSENSRVFHRPARVYAVRYLGELLVATSGPKILLMEVKDVVVGYLEGELGLSVDKLVSSIHSAVSEKMFFMGMEIQAVPPSVLHPPMSEKAMRAQKKYLKRKAAQALELRNARETRRKRLGLQILMQAFLKLKQDDGFDLDLDFEIKDEVRDIFQYWGEEVAREFLSSKDQCWDMYRALSGGDFLELKKIRDQLPSELVDAYDQFQKNVEKYLMPGSPGKFTCRELDSEGGEAEQECEDAEDHRGEGEEEKRYAERTIDDLTKLCMKVDAPLELIRRAVKLAGFTNAMGRPRPIKLLICLDDSDIIKWYAGIARRWLDFYCCCHNFKMVKTMVNYHLRFSCILTLAEKHESTKLQTIKHYTKDLKVCDADGKEVVYFPTEREIKMMGNKNLSDPMPVDSALCLILVRLASGETASPCVGYFCGRTDVSLYRIRLLQNRLNIDPLNDKKWVPGLGAIHECLNKKCIPLCSKHVSDLYMGRVSLQDVDCSSFVDVK